MYGLLVFLSKLWRLLNGQFNQDLQVIMNWTNKGLMLYDYNHFGKKTVYKFFLQIWV